MKVNGLDLIEIKSIYETISTVTDIKQLVREKFIADAFAVIYLDYKVLIGTFNNGEFHFHNGENFDDKFVQRARIFDKDKELHIWRTVEGLNARLRIDVDGQDTVVVDAKQVLFGTMARPLSDGFTELTEARGTRIIVPFTNLSIDEKKKRFFLHTRNYVGFNETFQAGYVDCRFVEISEKEG